MFVAPNRDNTVNQILNEISQKITRVSEHELTGFGLNKALALRALNISDIWEDNLLSTELYTCILDNGTRDYIITYKQILAATYRLLTKDKPLEEQKAITLLFVSILQNQACPGGRANTCVEHYNNTINQHKEVQWKILPTNAEYLLHYLINFYSINVDTTTKIGVIPTPEHNKFLQICWAIFENYTTNNAATASEAIKNVVAGIATREHFGGDFMSNHDNISAARRSLKEYQDTNGNIPDLTQEQKNVLTQVFNQQNPYRQLNTQENALIQTYTIDEEKDVFSFSIEKVKTLWQDLIAKSMHFETGIIPMPSDDVLIDFNNNDPKQSFITDHNRAISVDYIINHAKLNREKAQYGQPNAEVYLELSQRFFGERDDICTRLFAATVSRNLNLFNNFLNLNNVFLLTDFANAFNERLQLLAIGMQDVDGLNLIEDKDEQKIIFIDSNWEAGLNFKQEIEHLLTREKTLLTQLEIDKHLRAGHVIDEALSKEIDNKVGKLVFAQACEYSGTSENIRLFLNKLSDEEKIIFFNLSNQESLNDAKSLSEELRRLNVRRFEIIPKLLNKREGSVHKGNDVIREDENKYNQNANLRSNKKFLQICYASIAEAAQHFTQTDIDNDEDIKLIHQTFNFNLSEDDDQHFEGMTREHPNINEGKQALADFRDWVAIGKQGHFPGLRPVDAQMLEELGVAKITVQSDRIATAEAERLRQQQEAAVSAQARQHQQQPQQTAADLQRNLLLHLVRENALAGRRNRQQQAVTAESERQRQQQAQQAAAEAERQRQQQQAQQTNTPSVPSFRRRLRLI